MLVSLTSYAVYSYYHGIRNYSIPNEVTTSETGLHVLSYAGNLSEMSAEISHPTQTYIATSNYCELQGKPLATQIVKS